MFDMDLMLRWSTGEELTEGETLTLFSQLIETGYAWRLEGHIGRSAANLIERGAISPEGEILVEIDEGEAEEGNVVS